MNSRNVKKYPPFVLHLLGWSFLVMFLMWQPLSWQIQFPMSFWIKQTVLFALLITIFYLNYYFWFPRFLSKNRYVRFILLNIVSVIMLAVVIEQVKILINHGEQMDRAFRIAREANGDKKQHDKLDYFALLTALMIIGLSTSIAAVRSTQLDKQYRQNLEKEKINSELSFLKAQINPHFFFNTLNNIYALTVIDVEAAREALHKLSRMMRYVLYETQHGTVLLSQEIAFAQDYIQLMQLRLTDKVTVHLDPPSPLHDVSIAPMLFLPFIENAFKHGVSAVQPSRIDIQIRQDHHKIHVEVRNTLFTDKRAILDESNGIGLVNTQRRLDLLYPGKYQLEVTENKEDKEFEVHLELETA
ncbi:sensor histidine kinase [Dyadobacter sediminis]|uniref:Sensor histidine kinase n=1 Tax=Dyadobacter sediminis TaxID=1493691 RepID=A0A5R9K4E1_9BACT|nr:histidine kinase [Dyadobacter sediminis]TLU88806.1 sensor histidine kinase [Dyadobacter sediminis]GGC13322.1 sensor histidine kinase [Dyadobacter sediminis]